MADSAEIKRTLGGTQFGSSLKDCEPGDLTRGYATSGFDDDFEESMPAGPLRHPGRLESERYRPEHGMHDEYGFVRRPYGRSDVERN